jgi:hypothetical protein
MTTQEGIPGRIPLLSELMFVNWDKSNSHRGYTIRDRLLPSAEPNSRCLVTGTGTLITLIALGNSWTKSKTTTIVPQYDRYPQFKSHKLLCHFVSDEMDRPNRGNPPYQFPVHSEPPRVSSRGKSILGN